MEDLKCYTVKDLRYACEKLGIKKSGVKDDICSRLIIEMENRGMKDLQEVDEIKLPNVPKEMVGEKGMNKIIIPLQLQMYCKQCTKSILNLRGKNDKESQIKAYISVMDNCGACHREINKMKTRENEILSLLRINNVPRENWGKYLNNFKKPRFKDLKTPDLDTIEKYGSEDEGYNQTMEFGSEFWNRRASERLSNLIPEPRKNKP